MTRKPFTRALLAALVQEHGSTCWLCERPVADEPVSGDHVTPLIYGGTDDLSNLRPAHTACNIARGEFDVRSYYAWALARGREDLVPERLRETLRPAAADVAGRARLYYGRSTRGTALAPLHSSWTFEP